MRTRGGIIVEDIKIGDVHYEFEYGMGIKCEVVSTPVKGDDFYTWQSKNVNTGKIIDYMVSEGYSHYGPNLYNYEAYHGVRWI